MCPNSPGPIRLSLEDVRPALPYQGQGQGLCVLSSLPVRVVRYFSLFLFVCFWLGAQILESMKRVLKLCNLENPRPLTSTLLRPRLTFAPPDPEVAEQ